MSPTRAGARAALAALALAAAAACRPSPDARTSLLLITIDTLRADHVSAYGASPVATPHLDRIAREGARIDRAWSTVPLTTPAHASILTGLYPPGHGVRNNARFRLPDDVTTLAEVLAASGRATAAFVGSFTTSAAFGLGQGFSTFGDDLGRTPGGGRRSQRRGDEVVDRALAWLAEHRDGPFFLWVHLYDPHTPYAPPSPFDAAHAADPYSGEVAFADAQVGRLLTALDEAGLAPQTCVVAMSDHGEGLGAHGEREHGFLLYEETLRVPLVLRAPGRVAPGTVVPGPASLVDVLPTVLPLVGEAVPAGVHGRDLLAAAPAGAPDVYAETLHPFEEFGWSALYALRRGDLKVIEAPRAELYDLAADPRESRDLREGRAAEAGALLAVLRTRAASLVDPGRLAQAVGGGAQEAADPETIARLESLGYVGGGGAVAPDGATELPAVSGRNPVDAMPDLERFDRAEELMGAKRLEEARAILEGLVRDDPGNPQFLLKLAQTEDRLGRAEEAEARYWELVRAHPTFYLGTRSFSDFLERTGRPRESRDLWLRLQGLLPGYVGMEVRLARAELSAGMAAEAAVRLERRVAADAQDGEAWSWLGRARQHLGRDEAALEAYRRALALEPSDREALSGALALLTRSGRSAEATGLLDELIAREPDDPVLRSARERLPR